MIIEEILLNYLSDKLEVPVYLEVPETTESKKAPDSYVLLEKTGSSESNHIQSAVFAIQSIAKRLYDAALLNEEVKTAMNNAIERNDISSCKLNSDYNFTDTNKKQYRYQAVYDIVYFN